MVLTVVPPSTVAVVVVVSVAVALLLSSVEVTTAVDRELSLGLGELLLAVQTLFVGVVGGRRATEPSIPVDRGVPTVLLSLRLIGSTIILLFSPMCWSGGGVVAVDVSVLLLEHDTCRLSIKRDNAILLNVPIGVVRVDARESPEMVDSSSESVSESSSSSSSSLPSIGDNFLRHVGHFFCSAVHFFMQDLQNE